MRKTPRKIAGVKKAALNGQPNGAEWQKGIFEHDKGPTPSSHHLKNHVHVIRWAHSGKIGIIQQKTHDGAADKGIIQPQFFKPVGNCAQCS
ncbi:hypothetical protein M2103_002559 [Ereboglobus sp. PH5-5]|nr:hypothetical protein [Ereboglobus sp. PH5-5]